MNRLRSLAARVGWALSALLLATVSARLPLVETLPPAIAARGVERTALSAAYPALALGLLARRRSLVAVASGLVTAHLVQLVRSPARRPARPIGSDSLPLRVVTANLWCANPRIDRLADDLVAEGADVVVVQEVTPVVSAALRQSALWSAYPHRRVDARPEYHGAATFSRFAIASHEVLDVAGSPMLRTDLDTPHGPVSIVNVHTVAPLTLEQARRWRQQLVWLARLADRRTHPLILAGDFNATGDHRPFRRLVRGALSDAFDVVGRGSGATWPVRHRVLPRLLRLDHVVTTADVEVSALRDAESTGSDHARLIADLGIRKPASSSSARECPAPPR